MRACCAMVMAMLFGAAGAHAQAVQSFDELAASGRLNVGERIELRDAAGLETRGVFAGLANGLLVVRAGGRHRSFAEADVRQIRRAGGHAAAWGAAVGGGAALLGTYAAAASYGQNEGGRLCAACLVQWSAFAVPAGVGIGAALGLAIDHARRTTVYLASPKTHSVSVLPVLTRRGAGAFVRLGF